MYGKDLVILLRYSLGQRSLEISKNKWLQNFEKVKEIVKKNNRRVQKRLQRNYNADEMNKEFDEEDLVLLKVEAVPQRKNIMLALAWSKPYRIMNKISSHVMTIKTLINFFISFTSSINKFTYTFLRVTFPKNPVSIRSKTASSS